METKELEIEKGREFVRKVLAGQEVTNAEWFQYFANTKNCQTVPSYLDGKQRRYYLSRLVPVFPQIRKTYLGKGYSAIIEAATRDLNTQIKLA